MRRRRLQDWAGVPCPASATESTHECVRVARRIPVARWASYGDIADVVGIAPQAVASCLSTVTPLPDRPPGDDLGMDWVVPWHRIRSAEGRLMSRQAQRWIGEYEAAANEMFMAEGGRVDPTGRASADQRFDLRTV